MGLLSSLFGKSKSDANEQEKQDKKNFDILKYDGIRARNMGLSLIHISEPTRRS